MDILSCPNDTIQSTPISGVLLKSYKKAIVHTFADRTLEERITIYVVELIQKGIPQNLAKKYAKLSIKGGMYELEDDIIIHQVSIMLKGIPELDARKYSEIITKDFEQRTSQEKIFFDEINKQIKKKKP